MDIWPLQRPFRAWWLRAVPWRTLEIAWDVAGRLLESQQKKRPNFVDQPA
ncbi:MAG: hypothetical protein ACK559_20660 [bacterium]